MVSWLVAAALTAPWAHPLGFLPLAGWHTQRSGTVPSRYGPADVPSPQESTAWIATNDVRYRDRATADPPSQTLVHLPRDGVIVWAVIYQGRGQEGKVIRLGLSRAKRFDCCEGAYVPGGEYELSGLGPGGAYSVIVRIYFGSHRTRAMRTRAQLALDHLALPSPS